MRIVRHYYLIAVLALAMLMAAAGRAQEPNRAGLVVRFDDSRVETYCVAFDEPEITGLELLQRSGAALEVEDVGMGVLVCRVEETGCPADDCFCQCRGDECRYWSYWHLSDGEWRYSGVGAQARVVTHGTVEGWSWGPGSVNDATSPPPATFDEVCVAPDEAPTEEIMAAATETPASTEQAAVTTEAPAPEATAAGQPVAGSEDDGQAADRNGLATYVLFGAIAGLLLAAWFAARLARRGQ